MMRGQVFEKQKNQPIELKVGMVFDNVTQFRQVMRDFAIELGFKIARVKNEKTRVTLKCGSEGCE